MTQGVCYLLNQSVIESTQSSAIQSQGSQNSTVASIIASQTLQLWNLTCHFSEFEALIGEYGPHNFSLQGDFTFGSTLSGSVSFVEVWDSGEFHYQEWWWGNVTTAIGGFTDSVNGPVIMSGYLTQHQLPGSSPSSSGTTLIVLLGAGGAIGIVGVLAFVFESRRRSHGKGGAKLAVGPVVAREKVARVPVVGEEIRTAGSNDPGSTASEPNPTVELL